MCAPDCDDLAGVVASMGEMEAPPLRGREWTEGEVGEAARGSERLVGLIEDDVEMGEGFASDGDELLA